MKRSLVLVCALLMTAVPLRADIVVEEEGDDEFVTRPIGGIEAGQLEIMPIMSMRLAGGSAVYQVGLAAAYAITRHHQLGGSVVVGNRFYSRTNRRQIPDLGGAAGPAGIGRVYSVDEGFGASLTGFYRLNVPLEIQKQTFPYLELFGGRDFGWVDASELGGGVGARKFVTRSTAVTSQYSYVVLFADGQRQGRHLITAGVNLFFR